MISDEKKRSQKNLLSFLTNGKHQFLSSMGYYQHKNKATLTTRGIFGASLKSASICGSNNNEYGLSIPDPVYRCFEEISERGLQVEGIFRLSGAAPEVEQLFLDFDKPPTYGKYLNLKNNDIHAITGVVKKYLRQLPDPVIPIHTHDKFIQLYDESFSDKSTVHTLALMIQQLPKEHFHLLYYVIILAHSIQLHAETNMMNPEALAIVLAPVCTGLEHNLKEIPSWAKRHHHRPNRYYSSSTTTNTNTTITSNSITTPEYNYNMNHFIQINAKWTGIFTLIIQYSQTLIDTWKTTLLTINEKTPNEFHYNTIPCHLSPSSSKKLLQDRDDTNKDRVVSSHPNRHSTTTLTRTELLDIVVPPTLKEQRPQYQMGSRANSEELYKVVAMRSTRKSGYYRNSSSSSSSNNSNDSSSNKAVEKKANNGCVDMEKNNTITSSKSCITSRTTGNSSIFYSSAISATASTTITTTTTDC